MKRKLQIFVSSTYTDLLEERQAAVEAILKAGHIPAGMELFAAGDDSQWETIKRWIDSSDIYMLILGGRYGSIEAKSNISYTELEYSYAEENRIPLFSVVITESALESKVKKIGSNVFEKENHNSYANFRKRVLSKTSAFFNDSKDIKLAIYESINEFIEKYTFKGWVSGEFAKTQEEVEKINKMYEYINKLEDELSIAQKKLDADTSHLAQGNDIVEFKFNIPGYDDVLKITWDNIFLVISKQCIYSDYHSLEYYVMEALMKYIGNLINLNNLDAMSKDKSFIEFFQKIRIQFLALDLIDISMRTYGEKNIVSSFWSLTTKGKQYMANLSAIKRSKK